MIQSQNFGLVANPPPSVLAGSGRVVDVHFVDGGSTWLVVDDADLDRLKTEHRILCGRLVGGPDVNGRRVLIAADHIWMVMDVDS